MTDYSDYLEATAGNFHGGGGGDDGGEYGEDVREAAVQRREKDAVLCLVDTRFAMFTSSSNSSSNDTNTNTAGGGGGGVKAESGGSASTDNIRSSSSSGQPPLTPFSQAMRAIGRLYQDKIITSDRDLLGLALFNTAVRSNPCDLPGVYVIHPFNTLDVERVQEVEQLESAGVVGGVEGAADSSSSSTAYKKLLSEIGHRDAALPATLDEALFTAQHMLLAVRGAAVKYRRIFIFTNDDNPTRGDLLQSRRCANKVRLMHEEGVVIEVFALGSGGGGGSGSRGGGNGNSNTHSDGTATIATTTADAVMPDSIFASHALAPHATTALTDSGGPHSTTTSASANSASINSSSSSSGPFSKEKFWDRLIHDTARQQQQQQTDWSGRLTNSTTDGSLSTTNSNSINGVGNHNRYVGGVYVQDTLHAAFEDFIDVVLDKVHPQRPYMNCTLRIGLRSDGGLLPRMAVSVFTPIVAATGPKAELLEGSTNTLVKRQARMVVKPRPTAAAAEEDEGQGRGQGQEQHDGAAPPPQPSVAVVVPKDDVRYCVPVGGTTVPFTRAERALVTEVAAAGAPEGFTILCFKAAAEALVFKHALKRSSFLHANLRQGGQDSLRCFVQLIRTLRRQGKVAIALHMRNAKAAPRLVALVPSPAASSSSSTDGGSGGTPGHNTTSNTSPWLQFPPESLPAEGMGLYVVPLPYADDIRPVPPPAVGDLYIKKEGGNTTDSNEEEAENPPADGVALAGGIISALTVPYDITAVANPSVQLQYHILKSIALQSLYSSTTAAAGVGGGGGVKSEGSSCGSTPVAVKDYTLPDVEGMARHQRLFDVFNALVLGPAYDAARLCPQPKSAMGVAQPALRRAREEAGGAGGGDGDGGGDEEEEIKTAVREAAGLGSWQKLTVAQLRAYLKVMRSTGGAAKKKDQLIEAAKAVYGKVKKEEE